MKSKSLVKLPMKQTVKLEALEKFVTIPEEFKKSGLISKDFKAGVVVDKSGSPRYFIFDSRFGRAGNI